MPRRKHHNPFFVSDIHFGHESALYHNKRPYLNLEEMQEQFVANWNKSISPRDETYVIGDASFYKGAQTTKILDSLNGIKRLIKGNHDHERVLKDTVGWESIESYKEVRIGNETLLGETTDLVVLFHFPIYSWNQMHYGSYHLHGHCHGNLRLPHELATARIFDVGIDHLADVFGSYAPVQWHKLKKMMRFKQPVSVDHHKVPTGNPGIDSYYD